jgi:outer membrane protein OmpA-like peptidoglycan-associated protein
MLTVGAGALVLVACVAVPERPAGADAARARLTELQSDPELATRAPVAIAEADLAVTAAEQPSEDLELTEHHIFMAERKVAIAWATAQRRLAMDQREGLSADRDKARLDARTAEADRAHDDAEVARGDAEVAQRKTRQAEQDAQELRDEVSELNARATERGLLMTLGDVLFETGKADLMVAQSGNLEKLASFLKRYEQREVEIEGHTDDVGSSDSNLGLSTRRADAVKDYLMEHGVSRDRLRAVGMGEETPIADNDTPFGRQQNRRVEVIISNPATTSLR